MFDFSKEAQILIAEANGDESVLEDLIDYHPWANDPNIALSISSTMELDLGRQYLSEIDKLERTPEELATVLVYGELLYTVMNYKS